MSAVPPQSSHWLSNLRAVDAVTVASDESVRHQLSPASAVPSGAALLLEPAVLPRPTCFAVRPILESRGLRSSILLVTIRARTASPTVSVRFDSREASCWFSLVVGQVFVGNLRDVQQSVHGTDADEGTELHDLDDLSVDDLLHVGIEGDRVELGLVVDAGACPAARYRCRCRGRR